MRQDLLCLKNSNDINKFEFRCLITLKDHFSGHKNEHFDDQENYNKQH